MLLHMVTGAGGPGLRDGGPVVTATSAAGGAAAPEAGGEDPSEHVQTCI